MSSNEIYALITGPSLLPKCSPPRTRWPRPKMRFGWIPVAGNIRQPEAVERLFETRKRFGKLDIFVSNARPEAIPRDGELSLISIRER